MPRFNSIILYQNIPKIKLFLQKNAKFSRAGGFAPKPPKLPHPPPPPPPPPPPHCEFLAMRLHYPQWNKRTNDLSCFVAHINNQQNTPPKIFKKTTRMLRSDRFRVFKSSSYPKSEGFYTTIKYN